MLIIALQIGSASVDSKNEKLQYFKSAINDTTLAINTRIWLYDALIMNLDGKKSLDFVLGKGKLLSNMVIYEGVMPPFRIDAFGFAAKQLKEEYIPVVHLGKEFKK